MNTHFLPQPLTLRLVLAALILFALPAHAADNSVTKIGGSAPDEAEGTIRIIAGLSVPLTDEMGAKWLPAHDFLDGDTADRPELKITNTKIPSIYRSERYGMTSFVRKMPNGNYTVKLHFAATYEAIQAPGDCVFSFEVEGRVFKNFDLFAMAGGAHKAYVESVPVAISDGDLEIKFTSQAGNATISAIEIVPRP